MNDLRAAAQQALEAWQRYLLGECPQWKLMERFDALRAALAEPEPRNQCGETCERAKLCAVCASKLAEPVQEPVAWYQKRGQEVLTSHPACWGREDEPWTLLYAAPPQRLPLTEEEIDALPWNGSPRQFARAVEKAVWEKNHE